VDDNTQARVAFVVAEITMCTQALKDEVTAKTNTIL
jgi:hypothetical protein